MEDGLGRWKKEGETRRTNLDVPKVKREENDHDDDLSNIREIHIQLRGPVERIE
jgi:hypothetical protein